MPLQVLEAHIGQRSNACTLISVAVMYAILSTTDEPSFDAMCRCVGSAHQHAENRYQELLQAEAAYKQLLDQSSTQLALDAEEPSPEIEEQRCQLLEQLGAARKRYVDLLSQLSDASDSSILLEKNIGIGDGLSVHEALRFFSLRIMEAKAADPQPFVLGSRTEVSVTDKINVRVICETIINKLEKDHKNTKGFLSDQELENFYKNCNKYFEALGLLGSLAELQQNNSEEELLLFWQNLTLEKFIDWVGTSATRTAPAPSFAGAISTLPPNQGMSILVHAHTISVTRKGGVYYGYDSMTGHLVCTNVPQEIADWVTHSAYFQAHRPQILTISQWTPTFLGPAPSESESADMAFTSPSSSTDRPSASHSTTRPQDVPPSATPPLPPNEHNPSSAPTPLPLSSQPDLSSVSGGHVVNAPKVFEPDSSSTLTLSPISRSSPQRGADPRSDVSSSVSSLTSSSRRRPLPAPISPTPAQTHTSPGSQPEELPSFDARRQVFERLTSPSTITLSLQPSGPIPTGVKVGAPLTRFQSEPVLPRQSPSASSDESSSRSGAAPAPGLVKALSQRFLPESTASAVTPSSERPGRDHQLRRTQSERALSPTANTESQWFGKIHGEIRAERRESSGVLPKYAQALQAYLGALEAFFHNPENNQREFTILMPNDIAHLQALRQAAEEGLLGELQNYPVLKQWLLDARMVEKYLLINTCAIALQDARGSSEAQASVAPSTSTSLPDLALPGALSSDVAAYQSAQAALEAMLSAEAQSQRANDRKYHVALTDAQLQRRNQHSPYAWSALLREADALANAIKLLLRGSDTSRGEALKRNAENMLADLSGKLDQLTSAPGPQPAQYINLKQQVERVLTELRRPMDVTPSVGDATPLIEDMAPSPEVITSPPPLSGSTAPTTSSHTNIHAQTILELPDRPATTQVGTGIPVGTSSTPLFPMPAPPPPLVTSLTPRTPAPSEDDSPFGPPSRPASPPSMATTPIPVPPLSSDEASSPPSSPLLPASPATTPIPGSPLSLDEASSSPSSPLLPAPVVLTPTPTPLAPLEPETATPIPVPPPSAPSISPPSLPASAQPLPPPLSTSPPPLHTPPPPLSDLGTAPPPGLASTPVVTTPSPAHVAAPPPTVDLETVGAGVEPPQRLRALMAQYFEEARAREAARAQEEERQRAEAERQRIAEEDRQKAEEAARLLAERQRAEQERQRAEAERQRQEEERRAELAAQDRPSLLFTSEMLTQKRADMQLPNIEIEAPGSPAPLEIDDDDLLLNPLHIDDDQTAAPVATPTLDDLLERFRYHIARGNFNVYDIDENNARAPGNSFSRFTVTPDSQDASVNVITYQYGKGIHKSLLSGANALLGDIQFSDVELDDMARMPGNEPSDAIRDETVKAKLEQRRVTCVIENTDENPASSISRMQLAFELIATESSPGKAMLLRSAAVIKADGYQGDDKVRELARAATQAICRGVLPVMPPQELQAVCTWLYRHDNGNYAGFVHALTNMALEIRRLDQSSRHIKDFIIEKYKAMRPANNSLLSPNINANDPIGMLIADYRRISSEAQKPNESAEANNRQTLTM